MAHPGGSRRDGSHGEGSHNRSKITMADLLPAHIAAELRSPHMDMLRNAELAVARLADEKRLANERISIAVTLDRIVPDDRIKVIFFEEEEYAGQQLTAFMCSSIFGIFDPQNALTELDAIQMFIQALVLLFGRGSVNTTQLKGDLLNYAIDLELVQLSTSMNELQNDKVAQACKTFLELDNVSNPRTLMIAYCASILLLSAKQLNDQSFKTWTQRRVIRLAAAMKSVVDPSQVKPFNYLSARTIYQKMSVFFRVRANMVRMLIGVSGVASVRGTLADAMLKLLAWSEMTHVRIVQELVFGRYPEILAIPHLQGYCQRNFKQALDYLASLPEAERPYAKLLYSKAQTMSLDQDRFPLLTGAAHAIRDFLYPSFSNYKGGSTGYLGQSIKNTVTQYLHSLGGPRSNIRTGCPMENIHLDEDFFNPTVDEEIDELIRY